MVFIPVLLTVFPTNDKIGIEMDDINLLALTAFTKALASNENHSSASSSSSPATGQDFQQMLATMMMVSTMSGSTRSANANGGLFGGGELFSSVMLNLIGQLMAQQGESSDLPEAQPTPSGLPLEGRLTQAYGPGHHGLDFGVVVGTEVKSTMDGKVVYAGWNDEGYGNLVIVENGSYQTYYAHLSSIPVTVGQSVRANTVIGLSGNTGNSTGPHLHYEVRVAGKPIDPTSITLD